MGKLLDELMAGHDYTRAKSPTAEFLLVTPEMASEWLKSNTKNRPLSKGEELRIRRAMECGEWKLNGDTVRFDVNGVLIDGQKRLTSIVMRGVPVEMLVVRGLPVDAFGTIDQGQRRTAANVLAIGGVKNSTVVASIATLYFWWAKYGDPTAKAGDSRPTIYEIRALVDAHPEIHECAHMDDWTKKYISASIAGFISALWYGEIDMVRSFFSRVASGANLSARSPELALRTAVMLDAHATRHAPKWYKCALVQKAVVAHWKGKDVRILKVTTEGNTREDIKALYAVNSAINADKLKC